MKNEWRKIMTQFVWSQAKAYSYLINDISKDKKVCHKKKIMFENYRNCLQATHLENKINQ